MVSKSDLLCNVPTPKPDVCLVRSAAKCQLSTGQELPREVQAHSCIEPKPDPCAPAHNEYICHMMGERRQHYLNEVQKILEKLETSDCPQKCTVENLLGASGGAKTSSEKPMMRYPGYVDFDSEKYRQPFYTPMISFVPIKEVRPTSEIGKFKKDNDQTLEYVDVNTYRQCTPWALPRQKSFELKSSIMMRGCDCYKHNGLQDHCERSDCQGSPDCKTQPTPTCLPSYGYASPPPQRPVNDMVREIVSTTGKSNKTYCCCGSKATLAYKVIGGKQYSDCNHQGGPGSFTCYKCKQH